MLPHLSIHLTVFLFPSCIKINIINTHFSGGKISSSSQAYLLNVINTDSSQGTKHIMLQKQFNSCITDWAQNVQIVPKPGLFFSSYQWCRVTALQIFLQLLSLFIAYIVLSMVVY